MSDGWDCGIDKIIQRIRVCAVIWSECEIWYQLRFPNFSLITVMMIRDMDTEEETVRFFTLHSEKLMIGADVCPSLAVVIKM